MAEKYSVDTIWNLIFDPENKTLRVKGDEPLSDKKYSIDTILNAVFDAGQKRLRISSSVASYAGTVQPSQPAIGDLWYNPETGELKIYV